MRLLLLKDVLEADCFLLLLILVHLAARLGAGLAPAREKACAGAALGLLLLLLVELDEVELLGRGARVDFGVELGLRKELLVAFHEEAAGLLVEGALGEGDDEEALDGLEDVGERPLGGVPVLLERVHADVPGGLGDVGVEDLGQEVALRRLVGKLTVDDESTAEDAAVEGGVDRAHDVGGDVGDVALLVLVKNDPVLLFGGEVGLLLGEGVEDPGVEFVLGCS
mmetsp:Transcript_5554/g.9512  ORF Transcript_5554/g.9512 Transcript_5554/m.9512 type:complete len:224 (-) Transcript_5554:61-732(-)